MAQKHPEILAAWCEKCAGPGWTNTVIWYIFRDANQHLCLEALQPNEFPDEAVFLVDTSDALTRTLVGLVQNKLNKREK